MATEVEKFIKETLGNLPPGHPDREFLRRQLDNVSGYISRGTSRPEQLVLENRFTNEQREALTADGAAIYLLTGATITAQRETQREKGKPSFWHVVDGGDRLLALPSRPIEVAIFPEPERFFVPNSFGKSTNEQEKLTAEDAQALRTRFGLEGITQIIPDEAVTLTEIVFQHLDATGKWLFGQNYASAQGLSWVYGRTKNPTNKNGSDVAGVGDARPGGGLGVDVWNRGDGYGNVGAVRLVVSIGNK